jgi:hypothetical protein
MNKLYCLLTHWFWRTHLSRTPKGFADWLDTFECVNCGDRWCEDV